MVWFILVWLLFCGWLVVFICLLLLFHSFLTSRLHTKCVSGTDVLRQVACAATLIQTLQFKLAVSPSHRILTPRQPILALPRFTPSHLIHSRATRITPEPPESLQSQPPESLRSYWFVAELPESLLSYPIYFRATRITPAPPESLRSYPIHSRATRFTSEVPESLQSCPNHSRAARITPELPKSFQSYPIHSGAT